jgi:hypothetical protein
MEYKTSWSTQFFDVHYHAIHAIPYIINKNLDTYILHYKISQPILQKMIDNFVYEVSYLEQKKYNLIRDYIGSSHWNDIVNYIHSIAETEEYDDDLEDVEPDSDG